MIRNLLLRQKNWDKIAIIEEDQSLSYRDLMKKALAVQKRLPQNQRETIAIFLPNSGDYVAVLFGTFMAGMTAFPLNVQLTINEVAPLLTQTDTPTIITSLNFREFFANLEGCGRNPPQIIYIEEVWISEEPTSFGMINVDSDEPLILLNTSGTTGDAKIVQLSEKNVETTVLGFSSHNDYDRFEDEIKYVLGTPFSSVYGLLILSNCLMNSFPIVIPREAVTLDVLYKVAEKYQVTHYEGGSAVPILMDQMSDRAISHDIRSLKFIGYGGSKVDADVLRRLAEVFAQIEVCTGYGSTESAALITRPYKKLRMDKLDSVGIAIPGVIVMVESDGVITDDPQVVGEIVVKGPNVMLGYFQNNEETDKVIIDGYLHTGDIGYFDEEGFLYLCGRKKNVIMVRGLSVYAEEVEACLLNSGLVKDCIVYGETGTFGNEILCANLVPMAEALEIDSIRSYCESHMAGYKQPQKFQIVDHIKKTATGKSERVSLHTNI